MVVGTVQPRARRNPAWRGSWHALTTVAIAAVVATACIFQFTRPSDELFVGSYIGIEASAALAAWLFARRAAPELRLPCALIAAGLTSNVSGEIIWYSFIVNSESTDVSFADV